MAPTQFFQLENAPILLIIQPLQRSFRSAGWIDAEKIDQSSLNNANIVIEFENVACSAQLYRNQKWLKRSVQKINGQKKNYHFHLDDGEMIENRHTQCSHEWIYVIRREKKDGNKKLTLSMESINGPTPPILLVEKKTIVIFQHFPWAETTKRNRKTTNFFSFFISPTMINTWVFYHIQKKTISKLKKSNNKWNDWDEIYNTRFVVSLN